MLQQCNQAYRDCKWDHALDFAIAKFKGKELKPRVGRVAMAATIYNFWRERNQRISQDRRRVKSQVMKEIEECVRAKAWNWKGKRNLESWMVCESWGFNECNLE